MDSSNKPPTPPPLPPASRSQAKQSVYVASLEAAGSNFMENGYFEKIKPEGPYKLVFYFFYGTLTEPHILKHVLDIDKEPTLRPARLFGYAIGSWGQYPALIDRDSGEEVKGYAYEVQTIEHEYKLAQYETSAYKVEPCLMRFTDVPDEEAAKVQGYTFMYAGDAKALRAGRFDRILWELQMGTRLPEEWRTPAPYFGEMLDIQESLETESPVDKGENDIRKQET